MCELMQPVQHSTSLDQAVDRFCGDLASWARECVDRYRDAPPTSVHDQATYTTGWEPLFLAGSHPELRAFLTRLRDQIPRHFDEAGLWRHGYWVMQEAHHGTEHFELFLAFLLRLDPADGESAAQLVDAAEHMGNWSPAVPDWYDWQGSRFRSIFFGTGGVRQEPGMALNMADHLRCINICLRAYEAVGQERFLALAQDYGSQWAEAILARPAIPVGLLPDGPIDGFGGPEEAVYRSFAGEAPSLLLPVDRAENLLASDGVGTLLWLDGAGSDPICRQAACKLLDVLVTQLADGDAGAVAAAVREYRRRTGDSRYDEAVLAAVADWQPNAVGAVGFDPTQRLTRRPSGVGKRTDMPLWQEDGAPRRMNPITLGLAAEIRQDPDLAARAVDLARAYFLAARRAFPDGRDHGCAARTVSAVARGHGRENHAGMTTAVLQPMMGLLNR